MAYQEFYVDGGHASKSNLNAGSTNGAPTVAATAGTLSGTTFTAGTGTPWAAVTAGMWVSVYQNGVDSVAKAIGRVASIGGDGASVTVVGWLGGTPTESEDRLIVGGVWTGPNADVNFPFDFMLATMVDADGNNYCVNVKAGTYSITTGITHSKAGPGRFQAYTTSVRDGGRATIDGSTSTIVLFTLSAADMALVDFIFSNNGASGSNSGVVVSGSENVIRGCVVHDVCGIGMNCTGNYIVVSECEAYACNSSNTANSPGFNSTGENIFLRCIAHDNTGSNTDGFRTGTYQTTLINCIADTNGRDGFQTASNVALVMLGCDAYNNTGDGIDLANGSAASAFIQNCNLIKNGGYGINGSGAGDRNGSIANCGFGAGTQVNTSGTTTGTKAILISGSVTYADDATPWTDPANGDFTLALATAKGVGRGTFTQTATSYAGTTSKPDIGAALRGGSFPAVADVKTGTTYGAAGTEYTGTLANSVIVIED